MIQRRVGAASRRWSLRAAAFLAALGFALAAQAQDLRYRFEGVKRPVYLVRVLADNGRAIDSITAYVVYDVQSIDPAADQARLSFATQIHVLQEPRDATSFRVPGPSAALPIKGDWPPGALVVMDTQGNLPQPVQSPTQVESLPWLLGPLWLQALQPLNPSGQTAWQSRKQIHGGTETISYRIGAARGDITVVQRVFEAVTDGGRTTLKGNGHFEFDTARGLIQQMEMKLIYKQNGGKTGVSMTAHLVTVDQIASLGAAQPAQAAAPPSPDQQQEQAKVAAERAEAARAEHEARREKARIEREKRLADADKVRRYSQVPAGAVRTPMVGGRGGMHYVKVNPDKVPVLGLKIELVNWGGRMQLRYVDPIYERGEEVAAPSVIAKEGYVVSGLVVNGTEYSHALRVIFARWNDGKLDTSDTYTSEWIGEPQGDAHTQLAGNGEIVIGTFGKQGMNHDGIGLVVLRPPGAEAAELEKITGAWQKNEGKAVDLLASMQGQGTRGVDGVVTLNQRERLASTESFAPPVTFRIVSMTDGNDFRIGHAADQMIFNWEMNPSEFRIDGGPAGGKHKTNAGQLPPGEWVGIELVVNADELIIYINGGERYRYKGDFSKVNKPLTLTSHKGTTVIKSVEVIR